eukprot:jgi/Astpho2/3268/Aster-08034
MWLTPPSLPPLPMWRAWGPTSCTAPPPSQACTCRWPQLHSCPPPCSSSSASPAGTTRQPKAPTPWGNSIFRRPPHPLRLARPLLRTTPLRQCWPCYGEPARPSSSSDCTS